MRKSKIASLLEIRTVPHILGCDATEAEMKRCRWIPCQCRASETVCVIPMHCKYHAKYHASFAGSDLPTATAVRQILPDHPPNYVSNPRYTNPDRLEKSLLGINPRTGSRETAQLKPLEIFQ